MDLKPCPFCGSENLREPSYWTPFVECLDCGAFGPGDTECLNDRASQWKEDAARNKAKWNKRAGEE